MLFVAQICSFSGRIVQISVTRSLSSKIMGDKPIETAIGASLKEELNPVHLEVVNESYMHNVPKGSETHFKVLVVSDKFDGEPLIQRHRMVNKIVKDQLQDKFPHAFSIIAKTPPEWKPDYKVEQSPNCRGGFGK